MLRKTAMWIVLNVPLHKIGLAWLAPHLFGIAIGARGRRIK